MRKGIEEKRITLDYTAAKDENLLEPLQFRLFITPGAYDKLAFTFNNMTYSDANFEYKSADFRPGDEFIAYADSVATYLSLNPDKHLTIIGHTDSIGSDAYNNPLGLERAENARKYFLEKLEVKNPITVQTMGKRRPVAPNSTRKGKDNPEGRQKNRRVNFIIE
ncbi:MAG: OmpA family protein [Saprospiraceae bacterium]|nr:OmpA family protein [Saprospiraceae bacterium]